MPAKKKRLRKFNITEVSFVSRPATGIPYSFLKADDADFDYQYAREINAFTDGRKPANVTADQLGAELGQIAGSALSRYGTTARPQEANVNVSPEELGRELAAALVEVIEEA